MLGTAAFLAIHELLLHGLTRYARSDANKTVIASLPYPVRYRTRALNLLVVIPDLIRDL